MLGSACSTAAMVSAVAPVASVASVGAPSSSSRRPLGGEVQGIGVVAEVADPHVGAAVQEQLHALRSVLPGRLVERGLLVELDAAGVEQIRVLVEQPAQLVGAPVGRGGLDRRDGLL